MCSRKSTAARTRNSLTDFRLSRFAVDEVNLCFIGFTVHFITGKAQSCLLWTADGISVKKENVVTEVSILAQPDGRPTFGAGRSKQHTDYRVAVCWSI